MFKLEKETIDRIVAGDEAAFSLFYEKTIDLFYRYLYSRYFFVSESIDDVLSDFYLKCRKGLKAYNPKYKFESYVRTILKNHVKDQFKKKKETHLEDDSQLDYFNYEEGGEIMLDAIQNEYDLETIETVMKELDEVSYDIVFLKYIKELDYSEISEFLGLSQDAIRQRHSRALRKIKGLLKV